MKNVKRIKMWSFNPPKNTKKFSCIGISGKNEFYFLLEELFYSRPRLAPNHNNASEIFIKLKYQFKKMGYFFINIISKIQMLSL